MPALQRGQWNILLASVLLIGSAFIVATRAEAVRGATVPGPVIDTGTLPAPQPNHPAPDFTLQTLDGTTVTLSELKGQVALINIWATWCPPAVPRCRRSRLRTNSIGTRASPFWRLTCRRNRARWRPSWNATN